MTFSKTPASCIMHLNYAIPIYYKYHTYSIRASNIMGLCYYHDLFIVLVINYNATKLHPQLKKFYIASILIYYFPILQENFNEIHAMNDCG